MATAQTQKKASSASTPAPASTPRPAAVPDTDSAPSTSATARPGARKGHRGHTGPRLMWRQKIDGDDKVLQRAMVDVARDLNKRMNGRATVGDVHEALQSHPVFTNNTSPEGMPLSDLLTLGNVRLQWSDLREKFILTQARKPEDEGGLGLDSDATLKDLTKEQKRQMEEVLSRPKSQGGRDFPRLVIIRGVRAGSGLSLDDI